MRLVGGASSTGCEQQHRAKKQVGNEDERPELVSPSCARGGSFKHTHLF
jgi:hypothetical protein